MEREKLVVGSEWININHGNEVKVLFVGVKRVFITDNDDDDETSYSINTFFNYYKEKPKEPKKSGRLFMCLHSGEIKCIDGVNWKKTSMGDVPVTINEKGEVFEVIK